MKVTVANIEFWFEFASTYSYPAAMRIEELAASRGIEVTWRAFLLGPIFNSQGWQDSPFNIYPAKGRYMWRDVQRLCQKLDLPFVRPTTFPQNGLLAARIACLHAQSPWLPEFVRAVYSANFALDRDISSKDVINDCLSSVGQDAASVIAEAELPAAKNQLRLRTEQAMQLGIFGAPSFVVGSELFWGNDRLEDALDWCVMHSP